MRDLNIKFITIFIISILLFGLTFLPYLNLIFSVSLSVYLVSIAAIFIFRINGERTILWGIILFSVAAFFTLLGNNSLAEKIGNYIYGIIFFGILQLTFLLFKEKH